VTTNVVGVAVTAPLNVNCGANLVLGGSFGGSVMKVGVWSSALALQDIRKYMFAPAIVNATSLVGLWSLNLEHVGLKYPS